ncbi:ESPR-type extended signal peptide-containing protein [Veillonella sp.]|uniref:ESPR-type extended signal peptide-containing protein n=1 Tax=Veillonella sp. TaxID=1926307 RepID=UPI0025F87A41|nr:ESPR-type extended signal peptide-containing protein [Veillonella sp.]
MNKQYKIIWSKVKHCYVVVSELAKNNGKAASTHIQSGRTLGVALSVLALCTGLAAGVNAATPYYSVNDLNGMLARLGNANGDTAGGIGSTAAGLGTSVKTGAGSQYQGATATAVGMLNTIDASTGEKFDGVANAVVGAANTTQNANATLIFGAGNLVTNSYGAVNLNLDTINATDPVGLSKALGGAVKDSGGQILVVGGANVVDHARFSSITGVGNNLTGTTDKDSEYNFISGAKNTVTDSDHAYVIGTDNAVTNSTGNTLIGDNRTLTGVTNSVILGSGLDSDNKLGAKDVSNVVVAGYKANATVTDGVAIGSNSVASVAAGAKGASPTNTTVTDAEKNNATWTSTLGAVSVGYAADGNTPAGTRQITNVAAGTQDTDAVNLAQLNKVASLINTSNTDNGVKYVSVKSTEVAAGSNVNNDGASGENSIAIGPKASTTYKGDVAIGMSANSEGMHSVALGESSHTKGTSSVSIGYNSASEGNYSVALGYNAKSPAVDAVAIGDGANTAHTGSIAIGKSASTAANSMAAMSIGYEAKSAGVAATAVGPQAQALSRSATAIGFDAVIQTSDTGSGRVGNNSVALGVSSKVNGGNGAIAIGNNAYVIDTTQATVVGTGAMVSELPKNTGDSVVITDGSSGTKTITKGENGEYTVEATKDNKDALKERNGEAYGATALGSRATAHNLGAVAAGLYATAIGDTSVAIGNNSMTLADSATAVGASAIATAEDSLALGGYTNASIDTGVALGAYAKTERAAGEKYGYVPGVEGDALETFKTENKDSVVWNSNLGAISVGVDGQKTRQITNVAAGTADTDAVNVAQLKAAKVSLVGGENISSISTAFTPENGTTYTINAVDTDTTITKGEITYNGSAGKLVLTDSNDKTLEITGLRDLDTTGVTLNGDTLTFTRNDGTTYTVGGLATAIDLAANKIHYYSVNGPATPGGNYNNDGAKGDNALAAGVGASAVAHNSIAIGNKAWIIDSNGGKGSGDIAIGNGAKVENYADQSAGISLGQNAYVENMAGKQEAIFALGQTTFSGNFLSTARIPADPSKVAAGISIGENSYARSGSLMVGTHKYVGQLGDVNIDTSTEKTRRAAGVGINNTTIGTNSFNGGTFSTITGSYSITTTNYAGGRNSIDAGKNFGSTIMGSLNSIESATAENSSSGVANSVVGFANRTFNSNGSLIFGAGNEITNSVTTISIPGTGLLDSSSAADSAKELQDKMKTLVQSSNSGGATLAIGGGNKADYTRASSIIGVNNTLTGVDGTISEYNSIMGYNNEADKVDNVTVAGINNKISNTTSAVVLGDNHKVTGANNSIVIGSADKETELTATDATVIGHNANTSISTAVALGSSSVAAVDSGVLGYIPTGKTLSDADKATPTWTSTLGAVSVGVVGADGKATQTRQITGVAAGKADTDAVNVAQLQAVAAIAENAGTVAGNHTVVSVDGGKTAKDTTYVGDGNLQINVTSKDGQNTYDIKLSDKLTIGTKGEPGKDGEDGQPGTPGKAGTPGSITIIGQNGKDAQGNELPEGNNTSANISVKDGANGLDGKDGVTRIVYTDEGGKEHEVATMDDGLKFGGDTGTAFEVKLNNQVDVKGGITDTNKLSDNNIGVIADNGTLTVKLSKDLTGLTSINVGGTKGADGNYTGGITINNDGINMGGKQITNVASGIVNNDATDDKNAATIGDVKNLVTNQVNGSKAQTGKNITVDPNTNKVNLNDNITLGSETDKAKQVNVDGNGAKVTAGDGTNKVVVDGANGQVTIGNADNQIIMGNQEASPIDKDGNKLGTKENGQFITGLDNTTWEPDTKGYVPDRAATEGQLKDIADKINNIDTAVKDSSRAFAGDDGAKVTVKNGDTLHLNGGADATNLSDGNIGVVARKDAQGNTKDILDIKLSKDLKGLNSVTTKELTVTEKANIGDVSIAGDTITVGKGDSQTIINDNSVKTGNTTINNDGLTVKGPEGSKDITIQNNNVSMGGNQIKNVGDAKDATDAVNKGQLDNAVNTITNGMGQMSNRISKLDRRVDRVGAGAAALAALHPLEFSPEAKWEVSAGVGNYKGANALALGAFYRPNGDTMFSIGTSLGGGENMVNAGVTLRVGDGETENYPARKVMAQQIKDLQSVVNTQNEKIEQLTQLVNTLVGANQQIQPVVSAPQAQADAEEAQQA